MVGLAVGDPGSAPCIASGFFLSVAALMVSQWWCNISVCLLLSMRGATTGRTRTAALLGPVCHALGWGVPLLLGTIALATGSISGSQTVPFCLFGQTQNEWAQFALFYYPIAVQTAVALAALAWVVVEVCRTRQKGTPRMAQLSGQWQYYLRLFFAMFQFVALAVMILVLRLVSYLQQDASIGYLVDFVGCLLAKGPVCGAVPARADGAAAEWYIMLFYMGGQGIVNFVACGTQWSNVLFWRDAYARLAVRLSRLSRSSRAASQARLSGGSRQTPGGGGGSRQQAATPPRAEEGG